MKGLILTHPVTTCFDEAAATEQSNDHGLGPSFGQQSAPELHVSMAPDNRRPQQRLDFGEYLDGLYGYAMVLSRDRTEAEDLVQETCLRALRAIGVLRADGNAKSWLFTILRNIWLNQLRQRRAAPHLLPLDAGDNGAHEAADAAQDPHREYVAQVDRERVRAAIQQLPVEFREIILLREHEELSYQEIAALLDCPLGTVMSRLARARSRLRDLLSGGQTTPDSEQYELDCVARLDVTAQQTGQSRRAPRGGARSRHAPRPQSPRHGRPFF